MKISRYALADTCEGLLRTLERAHVEDKRAESLASGGCGLALVFFLVAGVGLVMKSGLVMMGAAAAFAAALIYVGYIKQHDLEDRKYQIPTRFLEVARADIPPASQLQLEIDFRPYLQAGEQTSPGVYHHAWLLLRGRFADGNAFRFEVVADVKRKEKRKRRGTKVRERIQETVVLRLGLNAERYPPASAVAEGLKAIAPPDALQAERIRALPDGSLQVVAARPPALKINGVGDEQGQISEQTLLATLVWVYRGLKGVKAGAPSVAR